ncbi:MAG: fliF [Geminicoccaceae bacterium]|nr:fliF [Geminicoccaceae bacterium]
MNQPLSALPARDHQANVDRDAAPPAARALSVLRALGPGRLLVLSATALALLAFFAYLVLRAIEPSYSLLYGALELDDSAQIVGRLEAIGVPFRLQGDGEAVLVPADQALRLRMMLAEEGLPRGGSVGNEIFDQTSALGTTNFLANVNLRRALEGELARTIAALADVRSARVHLVLPQRELFRRDQIEPSASVTLRMLGGRRLSRRQVMAVQHLVAAAVPGLVPERITLVDDQGTLLARGGDGAIEGALPSQAEELRTLYEERLKRTIEQLLERSLGPGRVQAEVSAELDLDQITTTEETFDPEGQVVRSTQTVEEESQSAERDDDDAVTVGNNLPNAAAETPASGRAASENATRTEETINYEISRKVRNQTQVGGRVRRLSVAVLVDGKSTPNEAGEPVYSPRDADELAQIESLVRSAIGFDATRGDVVEVKNMPFSAPPPVEEEDSWLQLTKYDLMRLAELAALALVALMLILGVVRPMLQRLAPLPAPAAAGGGERGLAALPGNLAPAALAAPDGQRPTPPVDHDGVQLDPEARIRAELLKRARGVIEDAPDEAVAIIRSWLHET